MPRRKKPSKKAAQSPRDGLNGKQRLFVDAYLGAARGNATEAARQAGYADANARASDVLRHPAVKKEISRRLDEWAMESNEVIARISEQAAASLDDFITLDEVADPLTKKTITYPRIDLAKAKAAGKLHLLKSLAPTKWGWKFELHDSQAALALLARYHGLLVDRHEHTGEVQHVHDLRKLSGQELAELARIATRLDQTGPTSGPDSG